MAKDGSLCFTAVHPVKCFKCSICAKQTQTQTLPLHPRCHFNDALHLHDLPADQTVANQTKVDIWVYTRLVHPASNFDSAPFTEKVKWRIFKSLHNCITPCAGDGLWHYLNTWIQLLWESIRQNDHEFHIVFVVVLIGCYPCRIALVGTWNPCFYSNSSAGSFSSSDFRAVLGFNGF